MVNSLRSNDKLTKYPIATYFLVFSIFLISFLISQKSVNELSTTVLDTRFFRTLGYLFFYKNLTTLLLGCLFLWLFGARVERLLNPGGFLLYYILFGAAVWVILKNYWFDLQDITAAVIISAVIGANIITLLISNDGFFSKSQHRPLTPIGWFVLVFAWFMIQFHFYSEETKAGVIFAAHGIGFLVGFNLTPFIKYKYFKRRLAKITALQIIEKAEVLMNEHGFGPVTLKFVQKYLAKNPENPYLMYWYIITALKANRPDIADDKLDALLSCTPKDDWSARLNAYLIVSSRRDIERVEDAEEFSRLLRERELSLLKNKSSYPDT